jgi:cytochrome c-type biogenesis protein CcmH/NrfG
MNSLGKRILVYSMMWVILVMVVAQLYDNLSGRSMPASQAAQQATPTVEASADQDVQRLADLQSCVASDPNNLQCNLDLANLYYQAQQWQQAQTNYERAVTLNPHDAAVLVKLAGTYIYQAEFTKAVPTLKQAVTLQPSAPEIHLLLGLALSKSTPPQMDAAVSEWQTVLKIAPNTAWATQAGQYISEASK